MLWLQHSVSLVYKVSGDKLSWKNYERGKYACYVAYYCLLHFWHAKVQRSRVGKFFCNIQLDIQWLKSYLKHTQLFSLQARMVGGQLSGWRQLGWRWSCGSRCLTAPTCGWKGLSCSDQQWTSQFIPPPWLNRWSEVCLAWSISRSQLHCLSKIGYFVWKIVKY